MSFSLGQTLATYAINEAMGSQPFNAFIQNSIRRHHSKDWGDCCEEDKKVNEESLKMDMRLLSVYNIPSELKNKNQNEEEKIWIITEADRSATTVLFPSEY